MHIMSTVRQIKLVFIVFPSFFTATLPPPHPLTHSHVISQWCLLAAQIHQLGDPIWSPTNTWKNSILKMVFISSYIFTTSHFNQITRDRQALIKLLGCTTIQRYLKPENCMLISDENGKFYVMHIVPQGERPKTIFEKFLQGGKLKCLKGNHLLSWSIIKA